MSYKKKQFLSNQISVCFFVFALILQILLKKEFPAFLNMLHWFLSSPVLCSSSVSSLLTLPDLWFILAEKKEGVKYRHAHTVGKVNGAERMLWWIEQEKEERGVCERKQKTYSASFPHCPRDKRSRERETKLMADIAMKSVWHFQFEQMNSNLNLHNRNHTSTRLQQLWENYFKLFAKLQSTQKWKQFNCSQPEFVKTELYWMSSYLF